jgi:hypothetical protein
MGRLYAPQELKFERSSYAFDGAFWTAMRIPQKSAIFLTLKAITSMSRSRQIPLVEPRRTIYCLIALRRNDPGRSVRNTYTLPSVQTGGQFHDFAVKMYNEFSASG